MKTRRAGVVTLSILVVATTAALVASWRPSIVPIASPAASSFAEAEIAAGARLAALGDCAVCHIGRDGQAYAGGSAVATPFGAIHATNITPDPDTGIGSWSLAAFRRAMTDGVARDGSHLYPAFPYNHFSMMGDDDIAALYAFLMTRRPVRASALANHLGFPFNFRPLLAAGICCSPRIIRSGRTRRAATPGIAGPIWSRRSAIAARAIPRTMPWAAR
ncbi:MAG: c-type cytochrome [Aliidongia sp.]